MSSVETPPPSLTQKREGRKSVSCQKVRLPLELTFSQRKVGGRPARAITALHSLLGAFVDTVRLSLASPVSKCGTSSLTNEVPETRPDVIVEDDTARWWRG